MSDNKENPLDRLTRPGSRPISDDETIPVLTERLTLPSLELDISLPQPPPPVSEPIPPPVAAPILTRPTQVTAPPAPRPAPPPPPLPPPPPPPPAPVLAPPPPPPTAAPPPPTPIDWAGIERQLRESVSSQLQRALADDATRFVRERLQPAIERTLATITTDLHKGVEDRVRDVVARAVAAEIARLKGDAR